jgi:hypothetical protein
MESCPVVVEKWEAWHDVMLHQLRTSASKRTLGITPNTRICCAHGVLIRKRESEQV